MMMMGRQQHGLEQQQIEREKIDRLL